MQGFIQLHRKMLEWEWYDDINTKTLFIHLLLKANWKDKKWRGVDIYRGEYITSFGKLSEETGLSIQQVRTSIKRLKSTQEVTQKSQGSFSIIEVLKYGEYQTSNTEDNKELTSSQQASNKELTTTNKDNKDNKDNKYIGATRSEVIIELSNFITYWNNNFKIERKITPHLENDYLGVRKKYPKDDIAKALQRYIEKKKGGPEEYELTPRTFLTQNNGFTSYL